MPNSPSLSSSLKFIYRVVPLLAAATLSACEYSEENRGSAPPRPTGGNVMKRYFKSWLVILAVVLLLPTSRLAAAELFILPFVVFIEMSTTSAESAGGSRQEIADQTKADADLYEVTLNEDAPLLTELLHARIQKYRAENDIDKAISNSELIAQMVTQDAADRGQAE